MKYLLSAMIILGLSANPIFAQFNWATMGGPYGSQGSAIFSNDNYAFVPENDFFYRSPDGIQWEAIEHHVTARLAIFKDTLANILFDKNTSEGHLQISTDNGASWMVKEIPNELDNPNCDIALCSHGLYLYNIVSDELYQSQDLGDTWNLLAHPGISGYSFYALENQLFLEGSNFLARTDPEGVNWEVITPPLAAEQLISDVVSHESNILVSTDGWALDQNQNLINVGAIWHSHDNGQSWASQPIVTGITFDIIERAGDNIYAMAFGYLLKSANYGISWDTMLLTSNSLAPYFFTGLRDIFLCTTYDKGVYRWDDTSSSLIESNEGLSKAYVYDLCITQDRIWASCGNGINSYVIQNEAWEPKIDLPDPDFRYEFISANDHGWVTIGSVFQSFIYLSEDNGQSWSLKSLPGSPLIFWVEMLGDNLIVLTDFAVFLSTDKGENWDYLFEENLIFTGITKFKGAYYMASENNLYSSDDDGLTWQTISSLSNIYVLGAYADELYAVVRESGIVKLYISPDGVNWIDAGEGFPQDYNIDIFFRSKGLFYRDAEYYYAFNTDQTNFHIYKSPVDQIAWSVMPMTTPMATKQYPYDCVFTEDRIYMGGEAVYSTLIENPYITATEEISLVDTDYIRINPNPADDFINIKIHSKDLHGEVFLHLYNANGTLVKSQTSLFSENIELEVKDLQSGVYFLQARIGRQVFVGRFVK